MRISGFISFLKNSLVLDVLILVTIGLVVLLFFLFLFLEIYGAISKVNAKYYFGIVIGSSFIEFITCAISCFPSVLEAFFVSGISFGIGILFFSVLMMIPEKRIKLKEEQKELVRLIDKEINKEEPTYSPKNIIPQQILTYTEKRDELPVEKITVKQRKEPDGKEIDYPHVRNILSRLDYYNLTPTERKQIDLLRTNVLKAESGDNSLKSEINEGLGSLLKIMSKYSV